MPFQLSYVHCSKREEGHNSPWYRMSHPRPPLSHRSKQPGIRKPPSSCRCPREVPHTLPERLVMPIQGNGDAFFDRYQGVANDKQQASVAGAVAGAQYIRSIAASYEIPVILHTDHCAKKLLPWLDGMMDADEAYFKEHGEPLFSSHMIDLSEEEVDFNIQTTAKYLKRAAPMKQWLEMVRLNGHGNSCGHNVDKNIGNWNYRWRRGWCQQ